MASRIVRNIRRIPSSGTFTNGLRYQSKTVTNEAAGTTTNVATSSSSSPIAASSAVRVPVTTSTEHNKKGNVVSDPNSRYNVESTNDFGIVEARKVTALSFVADNLSDRKAYIYKQSQSAMTSGMAAARWWTIKFDHPNKWTSHLMGWMASADTLHQTSPALRFESVEQAVLFCERSNIAYEVIQPGSWTKGHIDNQYAFNFLSTDVQTRLKSSGARKGRHIFSHPDAPSQTGTSTFVNYRYTQRGNEEWKPRQDGTYVKGVPQGPTAWTGEEWPAAKERTDKPSSSSSNNDDHHH